MNTYNNQQKYKYKKTKNKSLHEIQILIKGTLFLSKATTL